VLFVSHDARRTGAPGVLLNLLVWLKANTDIELHVLLRDGGPLEGDFARVSDVHRLADTLPWSRLGRLAQRVASLPDSPDDAPVFLPWLERRGRETVRSALRQSRLKRMAALGPFDLIYLNTIISAEVLEWIPYPAPVLTHIHELMDQPEHQRWSSLNTRQVDALKQRCKRFIAVAQPVKRALVNRLGVAPEWVDVCQEFVVARERPAAAARVKQLRRNLGIPDDALVVGGAGTCDWRKGPDLFIQLAVAARRARAGDDGNLRFVWIGGDVKELEHMRQIFDVERAGLAGRVHFVGEQQDSDPYFQLFDIFALTSRADPFPLVCLEAAMNSMPVLCFDSGGITEFVEDDCGFVVPYADAEAMTARILELAADGELRKRLGTRAAEKVAQRNDVNIVAPQILSIMESCIAGPPTREE
jgi:glycosyltransferase involved in cell wall biosynthesis